MGTVQASVRADLDLNEQVAHHLPVEVHCHGSGTIDFSDIATLDLINLSKQCQHEGVIAIPTLRLNAPDNSKRERDLNARRASLELLSGLFEASVADEGAGEGYECVVEFGVVFPADG